MLSSDSKKSSTYIKFSIVLIIIIISGGFVITLPSRSSAIQFIANTDSFRNDIESKAAFIDSYGYLRSALSPGLRWCNANPFLKPYNQSVILNLELQWISWKRTQLLTTYQILINYALQIGDSGGSIVYLAYPPSLPLPCPYASKLTRIGGTGDGSKILCGIEIFKRPEKCIVYSLGSLGNFDFEWNLLKTTSCEIHTYDCTSPPAKSTKRMTFHQVCLGDNATRLQEYIYPLKSPTQNQIFKNDSVFKSFAAILKENNHDKVHVLKMDIEGGEYSVLSDLLCQTNRTNLPYQISFESHWWNRDIYHAILHQKMFTQFWEAGYRILQHEHNPGDHTCVEWTLMRVFC